MALKLIDGTLYQWDVGRYVAAETAEVHFACRGDSTAYVVAVSDGEARIPDELVQRGVTINAWSVDDERTMEYLAIPVTTRAQPSDYVGEETTLQTITQVEEWVAEQLEALQDAYEASLEEAVAAYESAASDAAEEASADAIAACADAAEAAYSAAQWAAGDYYIGYDEDGGVEYVTFYDLEED